jgi:hypothetical protein
MVICTLDLPCNAGIDGLRLAAARAASAADSDYGREAREALNSFMQRVAIADDISGITFCYGKMQTVTALNLGAVETLLISTQSEDIDELTNLANTHGSTVFLIDDSTSQGLQFCNSFIIGGCLRWPVDPESLDTEEQIDIQHEDDECSTSVGSDGASVVEVGQAPEAVADSAALPATTAPYNADVCEAERHGIASEYRCELLDWLKDSLTTALEDSSTADALVACVEVVLGDDLPVQEEALNDTIDMLVGEGVPAHVVEELRKRAI